MIVNISDIYGNYIKFNTEMTSPHMHCYNTYILLMFSFTNKAYTMEKKSDFVHPHTIQNVNVGYIRSQHGSRYPPMRETLIRILADNSSTIRIRFLGDVSLAVTSGSVTPEVGSCTSGVHDWLSIYTVTSSGAKQYLLPKICGYW